MNERRSTVRHHCPSGPRRELFVIGSDDVLNVNVMDVSTQGIAFVSEAPVEPGTHLLMEVLSTGRPRRHMELIHVVRSEPLEEEKWLTGCSFVEKFQTHLPEQWLSNAEHGPERNHEEAKKRATAADDQSHDADRPGRTTRQHSQGAGRKLERARSEARWQDDGGQG
jgi:hypothetical protein